MVRVGGGWDTLEHYLLKHDPAQVKVIRPVFSSEASFLHFRSRYRSPTPTERSCTSRETSFSDSLKKSGEGNPSTQPSPTDTAAERSLIDDCHILLESLEETTPNDAPENLAQEKHEHQEHSYDICVKSDEKSRNSEGKLSNSSAIDPKVTDTELNYTSSAFRSSENTMMSGQTTKNESMAAIVDDCSVLSYAKSSQNHHNLINSCRLLSAPVGEEGDFQPPPTSLSSSSLHMMVSSCPSLDLAESVSDLTLVRDANDTRFEGDNSETLSQPRQQCTSDIEDSSQTVSDDELL